MWVHHIRTAMLQKQFLQHPESFLGPLKRVHAVLTINFMDGAESNIRFKHDLEPTGCIGDLAVCCDVV